MMNSAIFFLLSLLSITSTVSAVYKDCGSKIGAVKDVIISGCKPTDNPCILKKGTNESITIDFMVKNASPISGVTVVVHGLIGGIPIPWPGVHTDGCTQSGLVCPLKPSASYSYTTGILVSSKYPSVKAVVKWELEQASDNEEIVCIEFPVELQ
ncbi:NPC intracellular cholesterol transporter 2 homolog a-like [Tubulanus polymorphus]|uniref:NPC intracellular cholesterol transporter 2 homolog a-like n=1 Tax=Tubulanus polymorphus TaxID=672921 RepID=UPI003DA2FEDF